jgi:hypothetical protein
MKPGYLRRELFFVCQRGDAFKLWREGASPFSSIAASSIQEA